MVESPGQGHCVALSDSEAGGRVYILKSNKTQVISSAGRASPAPAGPAQPRPRKKNSTLVPGSSEQRPFSTN